MEFDHTCSNCLKPYLLKDRGSLRRLPLLLSCGHTYCGACLCSLARIQQHTRAINCPQCAVPTPFLPEQDPEHQLVPNLLIIGVLSAKHLQLRSVPFSSLASKQRTEPALPLPVSPPPPEKPDELCEECGYRSAEKRCLQCVGLYCKNCFALVHATSKSMRKHRSVPASEGLGAPENCPLHNETLKHFCQLDEVPICSECSITGQHHGHDVISLASAADDCREQLKQCLKEARERLKQMTATEKSLSNKLTQLSDASAARVREVHATFDQLFALLQCRKLTVLKELAEAASSYEEPVLEVHKALLRGIHSLTEVVSTTQTAMRDNLLLVRNVKKCMAELSRPELPRLPQLNSREHIRFTFDSSFKKQLLAVGSVTSSALKWPQVTVTNSTDEYQSDSSVERLFPAAPLPSSPAPSLPPPTASKRHTRSCSPQPARDARPRAQLLPGKKGRGHSASPTLHCTTVAMEDTAEVLVTHVDSPSEFYVTYVKDSKKLADVMEGVAQCCQPPQPVKRGSIKPGMVCAALYEDEVWYRCRVDSVDLLDATTFVTVTYTDYGNSEQVTLGRLSQLPARLAAQPPLCQKGSLFGVEPPKRSQFAPPDWSHRATTLLKSVLKAHSPSPVRMKVYREEPHLLQVDLLLTSASSLLSVREKLVSMGLATWSRRGVGRRAELRIAPPATPTTGEVVEVAVATAYSPSNFYVQTIASEDTLSNLRATLDREFEQQRPAPIENPQIGMFCCAQYSDDAQWYRAEVIAISGESIDVKYVDYGNTESVTLSGLATISRALLATPMQAVHCTLRDIEPLEGSRQWPDRVCDHFNAFFDGDPVLRMTVCGQGSPLPVVLTDKKTAQSLSSMLVVQGLANLHCATPTHSRQGSQVSETASEQVAPPTATPTRGSQAPQEEPLPEAVAEERELPALRLPGEGETVTCMVVQVTSPEDFHVSLTTNEATQTLSQLKPTEPPPHSWKPGQCGLAHFCGDSSWHRVRVEEVVTSTAQVLYLDYGNRDSIPATAIAAMPPAAWTLPPLAVRCSLVGVGPVGGAREWPHEACLFFSEQALDKTLALTVKAPSTPHLSVSLTLETGGDVACLLVSSGYAEAVSCSKGRPEAMNVTSNLPTDLEQLAPPLEYLCPAPLTPGEEVIVSVTFVGGGGVIHANLLQEGMLLPALTEQAQQTCHALPRMTSVAGVPPGYPCCCLFKEDGMFYRTRVEVVDTTANTATVRYVDFGNSEVVEASQLVDTAVRMEIPVQAVAMKLANTDAVEWSAERVQALWDITITESEDFTALVQPLHSPEGYPLVQLTSATGRDVGERLKEVGVVASGMDSTETFDPSSEAALVGTSIAPETVPLPKSQDSERLLTPPSDHDSQDLSVAVPVGGASAVDEEDEDLELD